MTIISVRYRLTDSAVSNVAMLAGLAGALLIGLLRLPYPLYGDQALFLIGARKLSHGALLYREFWDTKQPGIFGFYLLGGTLFGFDEVGIHLLELFWMIALALLLVFMLRRHSETTWAAGFLPLLTVGAYYSFSGSTMLTQVEALAGLPLLMCLWTASQAVSARHRFLWAFASGLAGSVVLLLKFAFLPIIVSFWIVALLAGPDGWRHTWRTAGRILPAIFAGLALPLAAVAVLFMRQGSLGIALWTFIVFPARSMATTPRADLMRLVTSVWWSLRTFAPCLFLGIFGAFITLRRRREMLALQLAAWCTVGLFVVLVQRQSWWQYHFILFFVPVGIFAWWGLQWLWKIMRPVTPIFALCAAVVCLFAQAAHESLFLAARLAQSGGARTTESRMRFQTAVSPDYLAIQKDVEFLMDPASLPGPITVVGDPLYHLLSGRDQATALNTWSTEHFLAEQWTELRHEVECTHPAYIYVSSQYADILPQRASGLVLDLHNAYEVQKADRAGIWYRRKEEHHAQAAETAPL